MTTIESEEGERHTREMRESRNRTIEAEVETRRTKADKDKVTTGILYEEREYQNKFDELSRVKK